MKNKKYLWFIFPALLVVGIIVTIIKKKRAKAQQLVKV